jgi:DNA topoisomerase I
VSPRDSQEPAGDHVQTGRPAVAGLHYSTDSEPGFGRVKRGRGFSYVGVDGEAIRDAATLGRIKALAIPPAWTDVWICRSASGHLQATGRDARGRKVYRYHPAYRRRRESAKYRRLVMFGRCLPRIRRAVEHDLRRPGLPQAKVLALVVRLLDLTNLRVGNEQYVDANGSYGLTTLRRRHAQVDGSRIRFRFRGKSGKVHESVLSDRRLAQLMRRCQDLPGQELFGYIDADGTTGQIRSDDVNDYLRAISGADITARDFRTWAGTVAAYRELRRIDPPGKPADQPRQLAPAIDAVAARLGNTRAVARASYIHPAVVDAWRAGALRPARGSTPTRPPTRAEENEMIRVLEGAAAGDGPRARRRSTARSGA